MWAAEEVELKNTAEGEEGRRRNITEQSGPDDWL
jgi:hypothetical protein